MELSVLKLTHPFLRLVVFLMLAVIIFAPLTNVVADTSTSTHEAVTPDEATGIDLFVYNTSLQIGGWFAWLGGTALELTFSRFVIKLGCYFVKNPNPSHCKIGKDTEIGDNGTIGGIVNELWQVIRDFFNILFIFAIVLIGFRLILDADDSGARRSLTRLVGAALLVNFSLYIAKLVLDIANFTATQIYSAFQVTGVFSIDVTGGITEQYVFSEYGIASAFMQTLQITSLFAKANNDHALLFGLVSMFFLMFLGAIFVYGAIMILVRFIAIILLLILSPVLFLGWVFPSWGSYSDEWRRMFVAYCFFAPAYVFMIYLSLFILLQLQTGLQGNYADAFGNGDPGNAEIFIFFFIGAALLFASTKVAGMAAAAGAGGTMNMADKWAKKFSGAGAMISAGQALPGKIGNAASYTAGYGARVGVNAAGSATERGLNSLQAKGGVVGWLARTRAADAVGRGAAKKMKEAQIGTGTTSEKESKHTQDINEKVEQTRAIKSIEAAIASGIPADIKTALGDATNKQIEEIAKSEKGQRQLVSYAEYLNKDKVKAIKDSKEESITESFKTNLETAYKTNSTAQLVSNLGGNPTSATAEMTTLHKASKDQLENLGVDVLERPQNAVRLSKKQLDFLEELKNDGKITQAQFTNIQTVRETGLQNIATGIRVPNSSLTVDGLMRSAEGVPDLPDNVIVSLAPQLKSNALKEIAKKSSPTIQTRVRRAIESKAGYRAPTPPPGQSLKDMDPGTMTDGERMYVFLNFDDIGKDLGR